MKPKSDGDYLLNPQHCPACSSHRIEATGELLYMDDHHVEACRCIDCDAQWHDTFQMVGYTLLKPGSSSAITFGDDTAMLAQLCSQYRRAMADGHTPADIIDVLDSIVHVVSEKFGEDT